MLKKKSASREKKRSHSQPEEQHDKRRRRHTESSVEDTKDDLADAELDRIGSDIEEGGLDLTVPFQAISAYVTERREMLEQCFQVLGEKKLQKMLPEELKGCSLEEIKKLCWEQLEQLSQKNLLQIIGGEELTSGQEDENAEQTLESQQDNNVDSTSSLKGSGKTEDVKQEGGGSGEESDVLSINADTYDSDIEGPKEEQPPKTEEGVATAEVITREDDDLTVIPDPANTHVPGNGQPKEAKKDLQEDIDKSVSEILAFSSSPAKGEKVTDKTVSLQSTGGALPTQGISGSGYAPAVCQPSAQQLELLELEMRARAIKALMKASDGKKPLGL
ncbi:caspase activity and apoptosis inhibitor 1 isoform X2 [Lampris incognitus]|uniref:caspase activity and apoptosis inhibitor 1 isoform X2 n=1 Tax=Lampris incognitus TaxID=2546036 RepID=UPI0024B5C0CF|nr:caspase activity and apoptosis inhibitor 1 isoform X2 [Lampris incognitus]